MRYWDIFLCKNQSFPKLACAFNHLLTLNRLPRNSVWQPLLNDLKRVLAADVAIVAGSNKLVPTSSLKYISITSRIDFMIWCKSSNSTLYQWSLRIIWNNIDYLAEFLRLVQFNDKFEQHQRIRTMYCAPF